jgi:hypothetical protein
MPVVDAILVNVVAAVLLLLLTWLTPVAPSKESVAPVVSLKLIVSIPETLEAATVVPAAEPVIFSTSLPSPPTNVSEVLKVAFA